MITFFAFCLFSCMEPSQAVGHFFKSLVKEMDISEIDVDKVIREMKNDRDYAEDYIETIIDLERKTYLQKGEENLKKCEHFLEEIKNKSVEVVKDKLYFEVMQSGTGNPLNEKGRFLLTCKSLDQEIFVETKKPISIHLKETILGFSLGINKMVEGEKRRLYIHPDLGYGPFRPNLVNQLLIIDVELVSVSE